jgi:hypothetical protein
VVLLAVPPEHNPLTLLLLFEHQPEDRRFALSSVVSIASDRNFSYPVRLKELFGTPCYRPRR